MASSRLLRNTIAPILCLWCMGGSCPPHPENPDGGTPPPPIVLRPGVAEWLRGSAVDPGVGTVGILDGAVDGQRVALLGFRLASASVPVLLLSEDQGATFTRHELPLAADRNVGTTNQGFLGYYLHLYQGHILLLVHGSFVGAMNQDVGFWQIMEVDPATNDYSGQARLQDGSLDRRGGSISNYTLEVDPRGGGGTYVYQRYDIATRKVSFVPTNFVPGLGKCAENGGLSLFTADGHRFATYCQASTPADARCLLTADVATTSPPVHSCVPTGFWPPNAWPNNGIPFFAFGPGGLLQLYASRGHAFAVGISPPAAAGGQPLVRPAIDLGAGEPRYSFPWYPRFGGLIPLATGSGGRLVKLGASGAPMEVPVPPLPCVDAAHCGYPVPTSYGQVGWILPLGGDDYLVAYYAKEQLFSVNPERVLVSREHVPPQPIADAPLLPDLSPLPGYLGAVGATQLEMQCARVSACFFGKAAGTGISRCIEDWNKLYAITSAKDVAYQAFLATPAGCDSFYDTYPEFDWHTRLGCTPGCFGQVAVSCNAGVANGLNCRTRGLPCRVDAQGRGTCSYAGAVAACPNSRCDSAGHALQCIDLNSGPYVIESDCPGLGLSCGLVLPGPSQGPICTTGNCPAGKTATCDGDVASLCATPGDLIVTRVDCARLAMHCQADVGCLPNITGPAAATCPVGGAEAQCQGNYLVFCESGLAHYVDCRLLGYGNCVTLAGPPLTAHCAQ